MEKVIEGSGFYRFDIEVFYYFRFKILQKVKMLNNLYVGKYWL